MVTWLTCLFIILTQSANLEWQCFDSDPLHYCSELDTSVSITSLINEMKYFDANYEFLPYGVVYNISVINTTENGNILSSIYMIGSNGMTTTSQIQWDISTFFMDLFLNKTDAKYVFVETEYDGFHFGLKLYDYAMRNNASKYMHYVTAIYDKASSPVQDFAAFIKLVRSNSLHHRFQMSQFFGLTLKSAISAEMQETMRGFQDLGPPINVTLKSLESLETYWDLWVAQQRIDRDKLYRTQYQTLFQNYFALMDSLLTYAYWYQDSNLYDSVFRWKQKSYFIFQRWLFNAKCVQIERDNSWIAQLSDAILNECNAKHKCDTILIAEVHNLERVIAKVETALNNVLNTNAIRFDVHRVKIDWLPHVDESRDKQAIESAVKETVRAFAKDLELFVSWQSQT